MFARARTALKDRRIFQYEAAKKLKISETRLSRILCGRIEPTVDEKWAFARLVQMSVDELFGALCLVAWLGTHLWRLS